MEVRNGIAYSGDQAECGTLEQKIEHAITNNINYIQIRTKDIQDMITVDNKINKSKVDEFVSLLGKYSGTISVHLPNPVWDYDNLNLSPKNELLISIIKDLLLPIGIKDYTIHPHFSRQVYESIGLEQRKEVLDKMSTYFSKVTNLGVNLAIENIPVRDLEKVKAMPESDKKQKALKNISYGMTIDEIENIINLTKSKVNQGRVGMTYDTGHSLSMVEDENIKKDVMDEWIEHFKNDIIIYHVAPKIGNEQFGLREDVKEYDLDLIRFIYDESERYNIDALTFFEAHASFDKLTELNNISNEAKINIVRGNS